MKKLLTEKQTFQKSKPKSKSKDFSILNKPWQMDCLQFSIKINGVYFVNSAHNNMINWDKIYDNLARKVYIWSSIQLFLREKKINANEMIWWNIRHIGQIYYNVLKDIGKKIEETIKNFLWSNKKLYIPGT